MNKLFCVLLVSLFMNVGANAQTVEGDWQGTIKVDDWCFACGYTLQKMKRGR